MDRHRRSGVLGGGLAVKYAWAQVAGFPCARL